MNQEVIKKAIREPYCIGCAWPYKGCQEEGRCYWFKMAYDRFLATITPLIEQTKQEERTRLYDKSLSGRWCKSVFCKNFNKAEGFPIKDEDCEGCITECASFQPLLKEDFDHPEAVEREASHG